MKTALISSCLLGLNTRYDGTNNYSQGVIDFLAEHDIMPIPVCPEQLSGLATPRPKCWFKHGDGEAALSGNGELCDEFGNDVTAPFMDGARQTLTIAKMTNCHMAILQQRSPSCGTRWIYLNQQLTTGMGVTAAILVDNGIELFSEDNLPSLKAVKDLHHQ